MLQPDMLNVERWLPGTQQAQNHLNSASKEKKKSCIEMSIYLYVQVSLVFFLFFILIILFGTWRCVIFFMYSDGLSFGESKHR